MKHAPARLILLSILSAANLPMASRGQDGQIDISAEITTGKSRIFCNEVFPLTLSIRASGMQLSKNTTVNDLFQAGKLVQVAAFKELQPSQTLQGRTLSETRRFVCDARAVQPGSLQIAPQAQVGIIERRNSFFGPQWVETPGTIPVKALTLSVLPLPAAGRPADFSGAVGSFSFDVAVSPLDVAVGDLITARMKISGKGYLQDIQPPGISPGRHFKAYDPKPLPASTPGELAFEQTLVPQSTNAARISAISFSYFDPPSEAYKTITRGPFPLTFHAAEKVIQGTGFRPGASATNPPGGGLLPGVTGRRSATPVLSAGIRLLISGLVNGTTGCEEAVVAKDERARLAPADSALGLFDVHKGSPVFIVERYRNWTKISSSGNRGWVPDEALERSGVER